MTTLTEKWTRIGKNLVLKLFHDDGRLAGTVLHKPATIAGAMTEFEARPEGGAARTFRSVEAAKLYTSAFGIEAEYTARAIGRGLTIKQVARGTNMTDKQMSHRPHGCSVDCSGRD